MHTLQTTNATVHFNSDFSSIKLTNSDGFSVEINIDDIIQIYGTYCHRNVEGIVGALNHNQSIELYHELSERDYQLW